MPSFLLPCECGQKLEVTAAQAGQRLTCACGRAIDVPTLRGLQSLERTVSAAMPAQRRWGARQGLLFLGAAIAGASLIAAGWLQFTRPKELMIVERLMPRSDPPSPLVRDWPEPMADFDTLSPADVWLTWRATTPAGADRRVLTLGLFADNSETHLFLNWREWRLMVWIIGGIGVAIIAVGLLIPARSIRRPTAKNRAGAPS
jgi:hypothetical protein